MQFTNERPIFCFTISCLFCEYWSYFYVDMWSVVLYIEEKVYGWLYVGVICGKLATVSHRQSLLVGYTTHGSLEWMWFLWYCHVLSEYRRVLDWQLDLLDHTLLHTITVYTLYNSQQLSPFSSSGDSGSNSATTAATNSYGIPCHH
jgi:hypothetical protein